MSEWSVPRYRKAKIRGYRAGIVEGCRLLAMRVLDGGESLDDALDDRLMRQRFYDLDEKAYAGISEVFSWLSDLDLDAEDLDPLQTTITRQDVTEVVHRHGTGRTDIQHCPLCNAGEV